jgi:hypothetical protein
MIVIWNGRGRLGNQLFQLAYIEKFVKLKGNNNNLILVFVGNSYINLNELVKFDETFKINYIFCIFDKISYYIRPYVQILFKRMADINVISSLRQLDKEYAKGIGLSSNVEFKKGFVESVVYVDGYFQFSDLINSSIRLKSEINDRVKKELLTKKLISLEEKNCGINLRFTDYATLEQIGEKNFILPINYFINAIKEILKTEIIDEFYVFTDDEIIAQLYMAEIKSQLNIKIKLIENKVDHLIAMSLCSYLIISPSTYGWWAWKFNSENKKKCLVPKYWLGYKSGVEYPPDIIHDSMIQIDVLN